jgi:hypothetical protein
LRNEVGFADKEGQTRVGETEKYARRKILIKVKKLKMKSSLALLTILNWRWVGGGRRKKFYYY